MKRPDFKNIFMEFARSISKRSTCSRRQVGCVIASIDHRYVYGIGYNGQESGGINRCNEPNKSGNCGCLHSEENAIINCVARRSDDKIIYVTVMPCQMCAKRIVNLGGVKMVIYDNDYHNDDALNILLPRGIIIEKF